jgi:glycosyltransferase involved in cell wall biosynthesis
VSTGESCPLITCIIPAYNAARYLGEAIDSVHSQTLRPEEIIVVDDGSTDATPTIAGEYGESVILLRQTNGGRAAACNRGLRAARGEFIAFLDADDLWEPEKLERQMVCLQKQPALACCVTGIQNFVSPELRGPRDRMNPALFRERPGFLLQTLLARRSLLDRIGAFNVALRHTHDTDWFLRARADGSPMELLPEVLVRRRLHLDSNTQKHGSESRKEYLHLLKSVLDQRRRPG